MTERVYSRTPQSVKAIETSYRRIVSPFPHPEVLPILERLQKYESRSMQGQPPVVWHRAHGFQVEDPVGNRWIDFTSGVLVANAGHGRLWITAAMDEEIHRGLHHSYCFPNEARANLVEKLISISPPHLDKVFLLTTGAEAIECAIKLSRKHGRKLNDKKRIMVSFTNAFHGRTLGAQLSGGIDSLKEWIGKSDSDFIQAPFPDGYFQKDTRFETWLFFLDQHHVHAEEIAGVLLETYQGGTGCFAPKEFMKQLSQWCKQHDVVLVMDEVQAGFGRCGRWFGFEHYEVEPDLVCCGKGISSGMPLSAVIGRQELMDQFAHGEMTSTHSGNPVCCRAALASIEILEYEGLVEKAEESGKILGFELEKIKQTVPNIGAVNGKGMVRGVMFTLPGTHEPDGDLAFMISQKLVEQGVLVFSPVGPGGGTIKINPPLCISKEAMLEGLSVFREIVQQACSKSRC